MLTSDELRLVAHATALRFDETDVDLWFAPAHDLHPEAHSLVARGYLTYRLHNDDLVWRLTDTAASAQELSSLTSGQCQN